MRMTTKQKLRFINNHYGDVVDFAFVEALASCAIEGNQMKNHVGLVFNHLWYDEKCPADEIVDSVYRLFKEIVDRKRGVK